MTTVFKSSTTWMIAGILLICGLFFAFFYNPNHNEAKAESSVITQQDGYQIIHIEITNDGFQPSNIELRAGVPTKLNFIKRNSFNCITSVESKDLDFNQYLNKGDNLITLEELAPGTYKYSCGMLMYHGTIAVK
ncbi:cupredoxin domain-containing protein [Paenibacillus glycanilyticus]|uniref:cupredoxin domain-containing protein n=1 Tax=Paenibacillus glycanilyticus TaxID=126569 RepID=UPI00203DF06B|nr:cupredoxin domain-containing protein [Paenibacillus glycanilyticus]MCM3628292.1 cupredoxin domain-containing protein [Paenibacillus glycanilyticus]